MALKRIATATRGDVGEAFGIVLIRLLDKGSPTFLKQQIYFLGRVGHYLDNGTTIGSFLTRLKKNNGGPQTFFLSDGNGVHRAREVGFLAHCNERLLQIVYSIAKVSEDSAAGCDEVERNNTVDKDFPHHGVYGFREAQFGTGPHQPHPSNGRGEVIVNRSIVRRGSREDNRLAYPIEDEVILGFVVGDPEDGA